jgi:hypothetical protein
MIERGDDYFEIADAILSGMRGCVRSQMSCGKRGTICCAAMWLALIA